MERDSDHFAGIDTSFGCGFAFPVCNASASTTVFSIFCTILLLIKELISQPKKHSNRLMPLKFSGHTTDSIRYTEAFGLIERWNVLTQDSVSLETIS